MISVDGGRASVECVILFYITMPRISGRAPGFDKLLILQMKEVVKKQQCDDAVIPS